MLTLGSPVIGGPRYTAKVEPVRVHATHLGLGFAPDVLRIVATSRAARHDRER